MISSNDGPSIVSSCISCSETVISLSLCLIRISRATLYATIDERSRTSLSISSATASL